MNKIKTLESGFHFFSRLLNITQKTKQKKTSSNLVKEIMVSKGKLLKVKL